MKQQFTFGIPAYNEEECIGKFLDELLLFLSKQDFDYEIIVVNDGSKDKTAEIVSKKEGVRLINHIYNKGYGASIKTAAKHATYENIFWIDADGQHFPKEILKLVNVYPHYDFVVGARKKITSTSFFRAPGKKILNWFASFLMDKHIPDLNSGFRICNKNIILSNLHILPDAFSISSTTTLIAFKTGQTVKYVPIQMRPRQGGKSTLRPFKDGYRFMMLILRATILFNPMRVFLPITISIGLLGLAYAAYGIATSSNIPEGSIVLLLGAVIMFFFSLISEQLSVLISKQDH